MRKVFLTVVLALVAAANTAHGDASYSYKSTGEKATATILETGNGLPDCAPGTAQYSGFVLVNATVNKKYFYWAFGPKSKRPDAPVVLWFTGGPGCSSALAALVENGPCHLNVTTGELYDNPYGWNRDAYLIFIDQPAGVGFSTADNAGYSSNEEEVSEDMYWFLQEFLYKAHPEFSAHNNELFLFGESYGGHYAPATAHKIFKRNEISDRVPEYRPINLAGLGVGNGLTKPRTQYQFFDYTAYDYCIEKTGQPCVPEGTAQYMNMSLPNCLNLIDNCLDNTNKFNCNMARAVCNAALLTPFSLTGKNTYDIRKNCVGTLCYNLKKVVEFMNKKEVQEAFGVPTKMNWQACNVAINMMFGIDWFAAFDTHIAEMLDGPAPNSSKAARPIRTLIYVGEMDYICNIFGNKQWTLEMNWKQQNEYKSAPETDFFIRNASRPVGKIKNVAGSTGPMHFAFAHVFDAGHMVPMDQPEVMYDLLDRFLFNKGWN